MPEKPLSLAHWIDSLNTVLLVASAIELAGAAGAGSTGGAGSAAKPAAPVKPSYKVIRSNSAEDINQIFKDTLGYDPPYKLGTIVNEIELTEKRTFIRAYDKANSAMQGGWVLDADDIIGLSAKEIQNKFALPTEPIFLCDVELDAGTRLRYGVVNPLFGNDGGGVQYDLIVNEKFVGTFKSERKIGGK